MHDNVFLEKIKLSNKRIILLQVMYWCFFLLVIPNVLMRIMLSISSDIESHFFMIQWCSYCVCAMGAISIAYPVLKKEYQLSLPKMAYTIIICISLMIFINILFSLIIHFFNGPSTSINQSALELLVTNQNKWLYITMVVALAPILEEIVFRLGIFRVLRHRINFLFAAIISSSLFGFLHVYESLFSGNYQDLIYFFVYAGVGFVLAYAYEYNQSIYAAIILHALYNFIGIASLLA